MIYLHGYGLNGGTAMNRKIRLVDADDLVISLIRLDDAELRSER